jgi:hypothetical protein
MWWMATFSGPAAKPGSRFSISSGEATALQEVAGLLATANAGKQAGLYTGFDPGSGSWTTPGTVTSAGFEKIRVVVGGLVAGTQRQIDESAGCSASRRRPQQGRLETRAPGPGPCRRGSGWLHAGNYGFSCALT